MLDFSKAKPGAANERDRQGPAPTIDLWTAADFLSFGSVGSGSGLKIVVWWFDSAPGHQHTLKARLLPVELFCWRIAERLVERLAERSAERSAERWRHRAYGVRPEFGGFAWLTARFLSRQAFLRERGRRIRGTDAPVDHCGKPLIASLLSRPLNLIHAYPVGCQKCRCNAPSADLGCGMHRRR